MFLYDYHMHSKHSTDGHDTINRMTASAIDKGLKEIAISDHFEPTWGNESYSYYNAEKYFFDIEKAKWIYGNRIKIKSAIELGQPHLFPEYSLKVIETHMYDYVLASAHKMIDNTDFGDLEYTESNIHEHCFKYFDELEALAKWNKFDCLAHLDLVKRYAANFQMKARLIDYKDRLEEVLKILIKNGKGLEVNTSGLRQASNECLPDIDIVSFYRQLGGEIITIGSDAHNFEDVGKGVGDAAEIIINSGFNYITVFNDRQPQMVNISNKPSLYSLSKNSA